MIGKRRLRKLILEIQTTQKIRKEFDKSCPHQVDQNRKLMDHYLDGQIDLLEKLLKELEGA